MPTCQKKDRESRLVPFSDDGNAVTN